MLNMCRVILPTEFLRGVLGLLGVASSYMAGRSLAAVRQGAVKPARHFAWLVRTLLCLAALAFRHSIDTVVLLIWGLAAVAFGAGLWQAQHRKPPEDLTGEIFPPEK
jgi:hypothetical protein